MQSRPGGLFRPAPLLGMASLVAALHLVAVGIVAALPSWPALGGLAVAAYTFGVRHAFDADHIAAIDNTTRSLSTREERPVSVGLWFSLGHSSIVFVLVGLLGLGVRFVAGSITDDDSWLRSSGALAGTLASGVFLCLIGVMNLTALRALLRARRQRVHEPDAAATPEAGAPTSGGPLTRVFTPVLRRVVRPWHMFGVGALFGLGFDTASEVALLALAASASAGAGSMPIVGVLALPVAFAAGMSLFDSLDGVLMSRAYGWALEDARRRLTYNLVVTALSATVALGVGLIEITGLVAHHGGAPGWLERVAEVDLSWLGFALAGLVALAVIWIGIRARTQRPAVGERA